MWEVEGGQRGFNAGNAERNAAFDDFMKPAPLPFQSWPAPKNPSAAPGKEG